MPSSLPEGYTVGGGTQTFFLQPLDVLLSIQVTQFQSVSCDPDLLDARILAIKTLVTAPLAPFPRAREAEAMLVPTAIPRPLLALAAVHCQHQHASTDALPAQAVPAEGASVESSGLDVILRMEQQVLVHVVDLFLTRQHGVPVPRGARPHRGPLGLVPLLEILDQHPVLHLAGARGMRARVVQVPHIVHEHLIEPLRDLLHEEVVRDGARAHVELPADASLLRGEVRLVDRVLGRAHQAVVKADVRMLRERDQRSPRPLAEATAYQVVDNERVTSQRHERGPEATLADDVRAVAACELAILGETDRARVPRHHRTPRNLRRVRPPPRWSPPLRVVFLKLDEAIIGGPVNVVEASVVHRDLVALQKGLAARLPEIVERLIRRDVLHHVPHAVDVDGNTGLEVAVLLVGLLQALADLRVVALPTPDRRPLNHFLCGRRAEPPLVDCRDLLIVLEHRHRLLHRCRGRRCRRRVLLLGKAPVVPRQQRGELHEDDRSAPWVVCRRLRSSSLVRKKGLKLSQVRDGVVVDLVEAPDSATHSHRTRHDRAVLLGCFPEPDRHPGNGLRALHLRRRGRALHDDLLTFVHIVIRRRVCEHREIQQFSVSLWVRLPERIKVLREQE
mmetsp:Transcript_2300/g.7917  ORF Transcript_2300/g.7917 Transcript_2300/m.7917 type:complete len:618 (-) Transcript_2300:172-2025(-)